MFVHFSFLLIWIATIPYMKGAIGFSVWGYYKPKFPHFLYMYLITWYRESKVRPVLDYAIVWCILDLEAWNKFFLQFLPEMCKQLN